MATPVSIHPVRSERRFSDAFLKKRVERRAGEIVAALGFLRSGRSPFFPPHSTALPSGMFACRSGDASRLSLALDSVTAFSHAPESSCPIVPERLGSYIRSIRWGDAVRPRYYSRALASHVFFAGARASGRSRGSERAARGCRLAGRECSQAPPGGVSAIRVPKGDENSRCAPGQNRVSPRRRFKR